MFTNNHSKRSISSKYQQIETSPNCFTWILLHTPINQIMPSLTNGATKFRNFILNHIYVRCRLALNSPYKLNENRIKHLIYMLAHVYWNFISISIGRELGPPWMDPIKYVSKSTPKTSSCARSKTTQVQLKTWSFRLLFFFSFSHCRLPSIWFDSVIMFCSAFNNNTSYALNWISKARLILLAHFSTLDF